MPGIDISPFVSLRRYLEIAHHIPGRIRLRFNILALAKVNAQSHKEMLSRLEALDAIKDIRVNNAAGTLIIQYAANKIPPRFWETLLQGKEEEAVTLLKQLLGTES